MFVVAGLMVVLVMVTSAMVVPVVLSMVKLVLLLSLCWLT